MMNIKRLLVCLLVFLSWGAELAFAQSGVSSMSMGMSRAGIRNYSAGERYVMPSPDLIRVEEFINYHRHDLPLPIDNHRVRLDLRQRLTGNHEAVIQIGLATARALDPELVAPLNLVLVIDQSGSMSGDRIAHVKLALHAFIGKLRKSDRVTIVGFNNEARVHLEAHRKTKPEKIRKAINAIDAAGSTNLHAGLMLGYREALKHYDSNRTNRVILLTDGRTNTGVVDLATIARESAEFNKEGIDLSTIGLGNDLNHDLLRQLADRGRGLIHFVGDSRDIEKTFVTEVDSLLAPAAKRVRLSIDFGCQPDAVKIFGYQPRCQDGRVVLDLDDLNHGATQVVMARVPRAGSEGVNVVLTYMDALTRKPVHEHQHLDIQNETSRESSLLVTRNHAIALIAESLNRAAAESNDGNCRAAAKRLQKGIKRARKLMKNRNDENVERVVTIAKNYRENILASIERMGGND